MTGLFGGESRRRKAGAGGPVAAAGYRHSRPGAGGPRCRRPSPPIPGWTCCATRWKPTSLSMPATFPTRWRKKWCSRCFATCRPAGAAAITCWRGKGCITPPAWREWPLPTPRSASPTASPRAWGVFRVPHGRANALLMAEVVAWNADYQGRCDTDAARKYARLAHLLDLRPPAPRGRRQPADRHSGIKR
ncbi:Uncharacterised protein [Raoultella terrigena]|uniref:Uncharacterized protein n=1 Tax=Raoultella terrigena TaxID=577 RepID=A0A3P8JST6_RAOTE|nr:Uncharacterised protein [Raoultella terrigena]